MLDAWADASDDPGAGLGALLDGLEESSGTTELTFPGFDIDCESSTSQDIGAALNELVHYSTPLPHNKTAVVALTCARTPDLAQQIAHVWRAGDEGMPVGRLQARLGIAASTLSHHLHKLILVGLVTQERQATTLLCRANYPVMRGLVGFLVEECCVEGRCATERPDEAA